MPARAQRAPAAAALALACLALLAGGCARPRAPLPDGVLVVSQEQQASWVRNFNPLTTATAARWPTLAGIYEPLFVFNSVRGLTIPWLASAREWREGDRVLRVTTRDSVLWWDGWPFSARDVAFTFDLLLLALLGKVALPALPAQTVTPLSGLDLGIQEQLM